jgi:hypothetical protein
MTFIKITILTAEEITSRFVLICLGITTKDTTAVSKIYLLPFKLHKGIRNQIDIFTIKISRH